MTQAMSQSENAIISHMEYAGYANVAVSWRHYEGWMGYQVSGIRDGYVLTVEDHTLTDLEEKVEYLYINGRL
jgi:hypothetical protein